MKISGFTFNRNGSSLYYPIRESIESILDLVDEFVVVIGDSDPGDTTEQEIKEINSPKIKVINTVWDLNKYPRGMEHAHQTDIAKEACTGDWLFYLQGDEVVHEKYLEVVRTTCQKELENDEVEGFLFEYRHFWADYDHYHTSRSWYPEEIRIIRNKPDIHSWKSAQSFRRIPNFDGVDYRAKEGTYKLNVKRISAEIYHYGWVRPPKYMHKKQQYFRTNHAKGGSETISPISVNYGPLAKVPKFTGTHPEVMARRIADFDWANELNYSATNPQGEPLQQHLRWSDRTLTWIERNVLGFRLGGAKNYRLV